jgi:hypothetical protein
MKLPDQHPVENPYASPQIDTSQTADIGSDDEWVSLRRRFLTHETWTRRAGAFYLMCGIFSAVLALMFITDSPDRGFFPSTKVAAVFAAIAVAFIYAGWALWSLRGRVRFLVGILSGFGLLLSPLGTIVNGFILYLVFSAAGRYILSPDYAAVVRQTPQLTPNPVIQVVLVSVAMLLALIATIARLFFAW